MNFLEEIHDESKRDYYENLLKLLLNLLCFNNVADSLE